MWRQADTGPRFEVHRAVYSSERGTLVRVADDAVAALQCTGQVDLTTLEVQYAHPYASSCSCPRCAPGIVLLQLVHFRLQLRLHGIEGVAAGHAAASERCSRSWGPGVRIFFVALTPPGGPRFRVFAGHKAPSLKLASSRDPAQLVVQDSGRKTKGAQENCETAETFCAFPTSVVIYLVHRYLVQPRRFAVAGSSRHARRSANIGSFFPCATPPRDVNDISSKFSSHIRRCLEEFYAKPSAARAHEHNSLTCPDSSYSMRSFQQRECGWREWRA